MSVMEEGFGQFLRRYPGVRLQIVACLDNWNDIYNVLHLNRELARWAKSYNNGEGVYMALLNRSREPRLVLPNYATDSALAYVIAYDAAVAYYKLIKEESKFGINMTFMGTKGCELFTPYAGLFGGKRISYMFYWPDGHNIDVCQIVTTCASNAFGPSWMAANAGPDALMFMDMDGNTTIAPFDQMVKFLFLLWRAGFKWIV